MGLAILIKTLTIERGWRALVNRIMNGGQEIEDERGSRIKELLNTVLVIKDPTNEDVPDGYFWQGEKLEDYKEQFINSDRQGFSYTYGNRLRGYFQEPRITEYDIHNNPHILSTPVDQVEKVIKRLKNDSTSRRATMVTFDPIVDHEKEEIPCMIVVDFKIRDKQLYTTGLWRSHDVFGAVIPNLFGLSHLAQYVAGELDVEMGTMTIQSISAHIYEHNWDEARKYIS